MNAPRAEAVINLADSVIGIIAEVTRYPRSILHLDADLEEELGIESVKRAEILSVLASRLALTAPPDMQIGKVRTIADVIAVVERLGGNALPAGSGPMPGIALKGPDETAGSRAISVGHREAAIPVAVPAAPAVPAPAGAPAALAGDNLAETVLAIVAEVTRYPRSILTPDADLEEE